MLVTRLLIHVLSSFPFNLGNGGGGVPGGVLDGDFDLLQGSDVLRRVGRHGKHTLLGLGP